jgi:hypothetical protein
MLNTITTVLVGLLGVHALAKFVFFALPYRRRRAALDKSYGDKPSATTAGRFADQDDVVRDSGFTLAAMA